MDITHITGITPFSFNTTPSIMFGDGALSRIGEAAARLGGKLLVVSDAGVVKAGLVAPALHHLARAGVETTLFTDVVADPAEAVVMAAVEAGRALGATGVIGLGGGSSLDVAKLAALILRSGEKLTDIYGVGNVKGQRLPLMLIPTTAGTGSEVTPISIVTTGEIEKKGVVSPVILPDIALLDPELTLGLPPAVTAATGVDAMVHAIEAFTSASANNNPLSRSLAIQALALLGANIRVAVSDGANRGARGAMLLGSLLAGQAFANSPVAAVHALAYPLGGVFHLPHGLSNALVLPEVIRFNLPSATAAYAELAPVIFPELAQMEGEARRAAALAGSLAALSGEIGLPSRLRDVGIPEDALPQLAAEAMKQSRLLVNNPRKVTEADAFAIYGAAW
jgi:alcohol dehydrogenase class IV